MNNKEQWDDKERCSEHPEFDPWAADDSAEPSCLTCHQLHIATREAGNCYGEIGITGTEEFNFSEARVKIEVPTLKKFGIARKILANNSHSKEGRFACHYLNQKGPIYIFEEVLPDHAVFSDLVKGVKGIAITFRG